MVGTFYPPVVDRVMDFLYDGPSDAETTLALAHGAGAAMDSPFMNIVAGGLAERGIRVARFEFPYMAARRQSGGRKPPDSASVLLDTWHRVIETLEPGCVHLAIGGKSMGGRMASMIADQARASALVCLGYPFHAPGKPTQLRVEHLRALTTPTLIVQGTRDPFGTQDELSHYPLSPAIRVHWLEDGDHSFKPRRSAGRTEQQNLDEAMAAITSFLDRVTH